MLTARRPPGPGFQGSALPSFDSVPHHDASLTSLIGRGRHGQALVPPIGTPELLDETKPTTSNTPPNFFFLNPLRKIYTKADPNKAYARNPISRLEGQSLLSSFLCSCVPAPPPCSNLTLGFLLGFRGPNRKKKKKTPAFPKGGESLLRVTLVRTRQGLAFVCKDEKTTKRTWKWAAATVFRTPRT